MASKLVMVVDDDHHIREALGDIIRDEGYEALLARNGRDAFDQLQSGVRPQLLLVDLMMPVMDGFEFCEAWKAPVVRQR